MTLKPLRIVFFLCLLIFSVASLLYYGKYKSLLKEGGDAWGYYIYLPSFFIANDLSSLEFITERRTEISPQTINKEINRLGFGEVNIADNGNPVIKYTSGVALMLSPFFLLAHLIASVSSEIPNDGFQTVYWLFVYLGVLFWVIMGLYFLYRILIRYFQESSALWTIFFIGLGSNLFYFTVYNAGMSHAPLFALYCILIFCTDNFWRRPNRLSVFLLGLLCGLISMIRPAEIICVFIPIFWNIDTFSQRLDFIKTHLHYLLLALAGGLLAWLPQLLYWKAVSGSWIFYSYGSESFNFLSPHIWKGLTSYQNGWLAYTPIMFFALLGMFYMWKDKDRLLAPIAGVVIIHVYIIYSWHNWYYINSFGSRPMVEMYALLAIPFAAFWERNKNKKFYSIWLLIACFFVMLNQFQTWQVSRGMMLSEEGSAAYYWSLFGKTQMDQRTLTTVDAKEKQPQLTDLQKQKELWRFEFEDFSEHGGYRIPALTTIGPSVEIAAGQMKKGDYLRIVMEAKADDWVSDRWNMAFFHSFFERSDGRRYRGRRMRINNKLGNPTWNHWGGSPHIWGEVYYFVRVPSAIQESDLFKVNILNNSSTDIWIRDFRIEYWTP